MCFIHAVSSSSIESEGSETSNLGSSMSFRRRTGRPRRRPRSPPPPRYKQVEARRQSFFGVDWPSHLDATPDKLVKAGFYYNGPPDHVKCGYCGGRLKNWRPRDSAIEEHLKHFPDCEFVQNIEKQTAVLSKNIRSKTKESNCVSSEELMRQHAEERVKTHQSSAKELWRKTLKKMRYSRPVIRRAENRLRRKDSPLNLSAILEEIHVIEKEEYMGTNLESNANVPDTESSDEGLSSGDEHEENVEPSDVDETVKLQNELRMVEVERDELQNLMICKICLVNRIDTLFLTCRHFATCHECADRVRDCPVCRQVILGTVDVFMA